MVKVDDSLLDAIRPGVDLCVLLAVLACESVQPEEIAILCLDDVLLGLVPEKPTQLDEVGGVAYRARYF